MSERTQVPGNPPPQPPTSGGRALSAVGRLLAVLALGALGACADRAPTEPEAQQPNALLGGVFSPGRTLVECPTSVTKATSTTIDALGGSLSLDGTIVSVPAGALLEPTTIELTIPASRYMEIAVTANGGHFLFQQPIAVTISYARCNRADLLSKPLTVWYIDSQTKALKQNMGGIDNKLLQSITFTTDHLSGYAIAF